MLTRHLNPHLATHAVPWTAVRYMHGRHGVNIPDVSSSAGTLLTTTEHQGRPRSFQGWGAPSWTPIMCPQAFVCVLVALFAGGASGPRLHQLK